MILGWLCSLVTVTIVARGQVVPNGPPTLSSWPRAPPRVDSPSSPPPLSISTHERIPRQTSSFIFPSNFDRVDWNVTLGAVNGSAVFYQDGPGSWEIQGGQYVLADSDASDSRFSLEYVGSRFCIEGTFPNTPIELTFNPPDPWRVAQLDISGSVWCLEHQFGYHSVQVTGMLAVNNIVAETGMFFPDGYPNNTVPSPTEVPFVRQKQRNVHWTYTQNASGQLPSLTEIAGIENLYFWNQSVEIHIPQNTTYMVVWGGLSSGTRTGVSIESTPELPFSGYNTPPAWATAAPPDTDRGSVVLLMVPLDPTQSYNNVSIGPGSLGGNLLGFYLSKLDFYSIEPVEPMVTDTSSTPASTATPRPETPTGGSAAASSDSSVIWKGILAGAIVGCVLIPSIIAFMVWYCMHRRNKEEEQPPDGEEDRHSIQLISAPFQLSQYLRWDDPGDDSADPLMTLINDAEAASAMTPTYDPSPQNWTQPSGPILIHTGPTASSDTVDSLPGQYAEMTRVGDPAHRRPVGNDLDTFYSLNQAAYESSSIGVNSTIWQDRTSAEGSREGPTSPSAQFPLPPVRSHGGQLSISSSPQSLKVPTQPSQPTAQAMTQATAMGPAPTQVFRERQPTRVRPLAFPPPQQREPRVVKYADEVGQAPRPTGPEIYRNEARPLQPSATPGFKNISRDRNRYDDVPGGVPPVITTGSGTHVPPVVTTVGTHRGVPKGPRYPLTGRGQMAPDFQFPKPQPQRSQLPQYSPEAQRAASGSSETQRRPKPQLSVLTGSLDQAPQPRTQHPQQHSEVHRSPQAEFFNQAERAQQSRSSEDHQHYPQSTQAGFPEVVYYGTQPSPTRSQGTHSQSSPHSMRTKRPPRSHHSQDSQHTQHSYHSQHSYRPRPSKHDRTPILPQQPPVPEQGTHPRHARLVREASQSIQLINANTGSTETIPRVQPLRLRPDSRPRTRPRWADE